MAMNLRAVPLATALLPAVAVHVCYIVAVEQGHISRCIPYLPDCVSISATVRHSPEIVVFRAAIIPTAGLMMIYWRLSLAWLEALGTQKATLNRAMAWLGMTAALGLFLYSSVLGEVGDLYRQQRRLGMILFYILTYLAQLSMTVQIAAVVRMRGLPVSPTTYRSLVATCGAATMVGAASLLSWAFYDDYRRYEDAFEWGITLLLLGHTFVTHFAWRQSGFQARFTISNKGS